MNTEVQDHIIDHVGAKDWKAVIREFAGKTQEQIKSILSHIFPHDDNDDLAEKINDEVN